MVYRAGQLAEIINGTLEGDSEIEINGLAKIEDAVSGEITFLANQKYERFLNSTEASVVIVSRIQKTPEGNFIRVDDPYNAFTSLLKIFYPPEKLPEVGIHPSSTIGADVRMGKDVSISSNVVVGDDCVLGNDVKLYPGVVLGDAVMIGDDTVIRAGASIRSGVQIGCRVIIHDNAVIGSEGFGFAPQQSGEYEKIPQVGTVIIGDDVEIGAGCTIDRATLGATRIEKGVKLDNLIQVAHNVIIGENTVIAAQTGISGSVKIGKRCMIGGQVGFAGHLELGDDSMVGAQSGISKSFPAGSKLFGSPAQNLSDELRLQAVHKKLPQLARVVNQLEKQFSELQKKSEEK